MGYLEWGDSVECRDKEKREQRAKQIGKDY